MKIAYVLFLLAYLLPPNAVIRRLVSERDELNLETFKAEALVNLHPRYGQQLASALNVPYVAGEFSVRSSFSMKTPGKCRFDILGTDSQKQVSFVATDGAVKAGAADVPAAMAMLKAACPLLAMRSTTAGGAREKFVAQLVSMGIDLRKLSLARFSSTVVYVFGSKDSVSSLSVYKDKWLPARLKFQDKDAAVWDVHFIDYSSQASGEWFPRVIEVFRGDTLELRLAVNEANAAAKLDDALFQ